MNTTTALDTSSLDTGVIKTGSYYTIINVAVCSISLPVCVFCVLTIAVIRKCYTIPYQIRYISTCFLLSDGLAQFVLLVQQFVLLHPDVDVRASGTVISRELSFSVFMTLSWASVATLAVERMLAISIPLKYGVWITKKRVVICISTIFACDIIVCACPITYGLVYVCAYRKSCGVLEVTRANRTTIIILSIIFEVTIFVSYVIILRIIRRHQRQIRDMKLGCVGSYDQRPQMVYPSQTKSSSLAIFYIVLANFILKIPFAVHTAMYEAIRPTKWGGLIHLFSFICVLANTVISGFLYVWSFNECRFRFIVMFCYWWPRYRERIEQMRIQVYSIVTRPTRLRHDDGAEIHT